MLERFSLVQTKSDSVVVGDVFGRLTVKAVGYSRANQRVMAVCKCACGGESAIRCDALHSGNTTSCGCVHREAITTHGLSKSAHYDRWRHMLKRCEDPTDQAWPDYGGRGISVCARWHDLAAFVEDLPPSYRRGLEIDRINNDGNYEPGNVRWASRSGNSDNRRSARVLSFNGKRQSLRRWSEEVGIAEQTLWERIVTWGWPVSRALTERPMTAHERMAKAHETRWAGHVKKAAPTPKVLRTVEYLGQQLTIAQLSERSGIPIKLLRKRIFERGWAVERAVRR